MSLQNTQTRYGLLARALHWLTAALILAAIGLALYTETLPRETESGRAALKTVFSLHKTLGVAAFFVALIRILWALSQPHPAPLHPERRLETLAASAVHWGLYGAMLVMPLSGWIGHAASEGFAPILWPFGQSLPFVPTSPAVAELAEHVHETAALVLFAALAAHILGALKHALIDRDATLPRMVSGVSAGAPRAATPLLERLLAPASVLFWAGLIAALAILTANPEATATATAPTSGNFQMTQGEIGFSITQMGSTVAGSFSRFTPEITYDPATGQGTVKVEIDITSLTLGTVTDQALTADFFDAAQFPKAVFEAKITQDTGPAHTATGTLTLKGATTPVTLPFTLTPEGTGFKMQGQTALDRRPFAIGASYADEATIAFPVAVTITLTATPR